MYSTNTLTEICRNAANSARQARNLISSDSPRYHASLICEIFFKSLADALYDVREYPNQKTDKGQQNY